MGDHQLLRDAELFRELDESAMAPLLEAARTRRLTRGDVVFAEDQQAAELYVVVHGRIAIANKSFDGRESMVALMERGDLFGEMSLFDGQGRSAEARALEPSEVIALPYTPIRQLYQDHPDLLWHVVNVLCRRLRSMDLALADSFFLDVTGRTAKRLLELAGADDQFELPITQEELAGLVGASRERVNKAIASFERLGWIEHEERRYRITNRRQLEIRAQ